MRNDLQMRERKGEQGFSLIELVISMVIFTIVTGAVYGVLQVAQQGRAVVNRQIPLNKSARFAMNLLGRDTYNAGYGYPVGSAVVQPNNRVTNLLGIPADSDNTRDLMPPIITANDLNDNTYNTAPGVKTDQVTFLFKDSDFNLDASGVSRPLSISIAAAPSGSGIDEIIPVTGTNTHCELNDIFLVVGGNGSTVAVVTGLSGSDRVQFSNGDILNMNRTGPTGELAKRTVPASMYKVHVITFFVTTDGILTRRVYGNDAAATQPYVDEPMVYGVEDFQIEYVMDNGTVTDSPTENEINLAAIRQVRYTISVRSPETGVDGLPTRTSMTSTFSTRNLGYDAN